MLKYEEKLHFDKHYRKLQSNNIFQITVWLLWGMAVYTVLYLCIKNLLLCLPDMQPWGDFSIWFSFAGLKFVKIDLLYFIFGLITNCYGVVKLHNITLQNREAKDKNKALPAKLLIDRYYGKVRHPMYGTFVILHAGFMLSLRSFAGIIAALIIIAFQFINARIEEKKQLIPAFGDEYLSYIKNVKGMLLTRPELVFLAAIVIVSGIGFVL